MRATLYPLGSALLALTAGSAVLAAPARSPARSPAPAAMPSRTATATLQLGIGRGQLVTLAQPISDVFVAADAVADVQVRSPTQLYVFGKGAGETTVSATAKNGHVVYAATVRVGQNIDTIGQMLALAMPESQIRATTMNGLVLLTGTVATPEDSAEAERLVGAYVGTGIKVLSRLKNATPLQVSLQVRVVEVNRNFAKTIGVNLASGDMTGGFKFGIGQGRATGPQFSPGGPLGVGVTQGSTGTSVVTTGAQYTTLGLAGHLLGLDLLGAIDIGENTGQVTTLANPNLTALSGETATFLAGGEVPIPIAQALGTVSVEYKQYGVSLAYTPTVLADGRISLRVRPEVSQLDYSNAVTLNGTKVPGITTRRAETTIELGSGQSFMIGGLLSNTHNNSISKAPFLGDLPVLGALFRSNSFQRSETELVIVVTPYLVKPMEANAVKLPTDGYKAPDDASRLLLGQVGSGTSGASRPVPSTAAPYRPAIGAASPIPVVPVAPTGEKADRPRKGKAEPAAPGFSSN